MQNILKLNDNKIFDEILPVVLRNPANTPNKNIICVYLLRLLKLVTALGSLWKHILHVFAAVGVVAIMWLKVFLIFLRGKMENKGGNVNAVEQQGAMWVPPRDAAATL